MDIYNKIKMFATNSGKFYENYNAFYTHFLTIHWRITWTGAYPR